MKTKPNGRRRGMRRGAQSKEVDPLWGRRGPAQGRRVTVSAVESWLKNFDPRARGVNYRPFFRSGRALGISKAYRTPHPCCKRELNQVSQLEHRGTALLIHYYQGDLTDVLEQYALPREVTRRLANAMGIRYPVYPGTDIPVVMTTDAVFAVEVDGREQLHAVSFKYSMDFEGPSREQVRCKELLDLERIYWHERGVECRVYTERDLDLNLFFNLEFLDIWKCRVGMPARSIHPDSIVPEFNRVWNPKLTLERILERCAQRLAISTDEAFLCFAECSWKGWLPVDLNTHRLKLQWGVALRNSKGDTRRSRP